jgi:hypothetical protein
MANDKTASLAPSERGARLKSLICIGFPSLSQELRDEVTRLIEADIDEWRLEVGSRLQATVESGRFTRRAISLMVGVHESYVSKSLGEPSKISERFIALVSVAVPGYEDVYAEFRRRADQLYLPGGQLPATTAQVDARLGEIARAMERELPAAMAALERLKELTGKVGKGDV